MTEPATIKTFSSPRQSARMESGSTATVMRALRVHAQSAYAMTQKFSKVAKHEFRRMKAERPMQTIAAIAGGAFLLGLLIRVRRTN